MVPVNTGMNFRTTGMQSINGECIEMGKKTETLSCLLFISCEGPAGPQGERGPEGPQGPVGPAGAGGTVMLAGEGVPSQNTGGAGDFYLDLNSGNLYGPKADDGWGEPINLKGSKGEDGQDGQDGEDGSQIYSGDGSPSNSLGEPGDYYLDKVNFHLYGPKTESGWDSPLNLQGPPGEDGEDGEDGNANVKLFVVNGHDFAATISAQRLIHGISNGVSSVWIVYLVKDGWRFPISGYGSDGHSLYRVQIGLDSGTVDVRIRRVEGPGEEYDNIHIIQIEAETIAAKHSSNSNVAHLQNTVIPPDLDISDYYAVLEYYGLSEADAIEM